MKDVIAVAVVVAILALTVACEVQVWNECRATNSWTYCFRVLGSR